VPPLELRVHCVAVKALKTHIHSTSAAKGRGKSCKWPDLYFQT
jgi:hypothetical protein